MMMAVVKVMERFYSNIVIMILKNMIGDLISVSFKLKKKRKDTQN